MGLAIVVKDLVQVFPDGFRALDGVDLTIEPGEITALVGANGAGKSTLLRGIVRLREPTAGQVLVGEVDVTAASAQQLRRLRCRVGMVFQRFNLVPRLTVFHSVLHGALGRAGARGCWPATAARGERAEAMTCLERVGLAELARRRVQDLSGGQQQRVAIARMLMQRPEVVLADEPTASLDPSAGEAVMALLQGIGRERGITVVIALHQLDYARRFTDRVIGMRAGGIVLDLLSSEWRQEVVNRLYEPVA
ncbi:MAG: phosphonate ABC transporter ATP-binding protein [Egibacteraceae bacterium]